MPDLPLVEAAGVLRVTTEALRKRIQRGTAPGYKRDGQWFASLPEVTAPVSDMSVKASGQATDVAGHVAGQGPEASSRASGQATDVAGRATDLNGVAAGHDAAAAVGEVRRLEELVVFLRDELAERRREFHEEQEARRREVQQLHTLLAQAQQRALPAPEAWVPGAENGIVAPTPAEEPPGEEVAVAGAPMAPARRPWWRFWA
jgi:hypothetical protein